MFLSVAKAIPLTVAVPSKCFLIASSVALNGRLPTYTLVPSGSFLLLFPFLLSSSASFTAILRPPILWLFRALVAAVASSLLANVMNPNPLLAVPSPAGKKQSLTTPCFSNKSLICSVVTSLGSPPTNKRVPGAGLSRRPPALPPSLSNLK